MPCLSGRSTNDGSAGTKSSGRINCSACKKMFRRVVVRNAPRKTNPKTHKPADSPAATNLTGEYYVHERCNSILAQSCRGSHVQVFGQDRRHSTDVSDGRRRMPPPVGFGPPRFCGGTCP